MEQHGIHELLTLCGGRLGGCRDAVEFGGEDLGVGSERVEPVDDETLQSGVGTVAQQGYDLTRFPHAEQGDRGPSLTFRQAIFNHLLVLVADRYSCLLGYIRLE